MMMKGQKHQLMTLRACSPWNASGHRSPACGRSGSLERYSPVAALVIVLVVLGWLDGLAVSATQINIGDRVEGRLEDGDKKLPDGSYFDIYHFTGTRGQKITIDLQSSDFDPYLSVLDKDGAEIISDNDSGGGHNARVRLMLSYTGKYYLRVNSLKKEGKGKYILEVK
jgi:hypothetical protein